MDETCVVCTTSDNELRAIARAMPGRRDGPGFIETMTHLELISMIVHEANHLIVAHRRQREIQWMTT